MLGAFLTSHTRTKVSLEKGVDDDFSSDSSVADDRELLMSNWHRRRQDKVPKLKILVSAFFVCVSYVGVFFFGWGMHPRRVVERVVHHPDLDKACLDHTSVYSPVLKQMEPGYKLVQFNGTLGYQNEFTGNPATGPSPEVDAAWEKWSHVRYASIPDEEFLKTPHPNHDASKLLPEYGGGYIAYLEVSHQMHCLNMLRIGIHRDYYDNPEHPELRAELFTDRPWTVKLHLMHCIESLRELIMCNADVGIVSHEWIKQSPDPFANFNTWHKCRDIESVERWIDENEIPTPPDGSDIPIPLDAKIFPRPP